MQDRINQDIKAAMQAGDKDKVNTLKMLKSALQMAAIDNKGNLDDDAAMKVLQKEAKKRHEAADMYSNGGDEERAGKERAEAEIIEQYLPEQMSEAELNTIVSEVMAELGEQANMGQVMGEVMKRVGTQADGKTVSRIVREKLNA